MPSPNVSQTSDCVSGEAEGNLVRWIPLYLKSTPNQILRRSNGACECFRRRSANAGDRLESFLFDHDRRRLVISTTSPLPCTPFCTASSSTMKHAVCSSCRLRFPSDPISFSAPYVLQPCGECRGLDEVWTVWLMVRRITGDVVCGSCCSENLATKNRKNTSCSVCKQSTTGVCRLYFATEEDGSDKQIWEDIAW